MLCWLNSSNFQLLIGRNQLQAVKIIKISFLYFFSSLNALPEDIPIDFPEHYL